MYYDKHFFSSKAKLNEIKIEYKTLAKTLDAF